MFFYLIHHLPLWNDIKNYKRNTRTFIFGVVCYILLHVYFKSLDENNPLKLFKDYFLWVIAADICSVAVIYKMFYGESITTEFGKIGFTKKEEKEPYNLTINKPADVVIHEDKIVKFDDDNLEEKLTCSICLGTFNDPSTTPCGHTFCMECLTESLKIKNECPTCKLSLSGFNAKINYVLKDLLDKNIKDEF